MCAKFGELDIHEIKEDVISVCDEIKLPLREVYVSADFQEEVYQVEVETFKDYEDLEGMLKEEILIEDKLKDKYGDKLSVNIISLDQED